jgi:two-component system cell cycle response regulator
MSARVLVVDDDPVNLTIVNRILQGGGHTTCCAHDGVEGLDLLTKFSPDIVVMDLLMPRLTGFDVIQRLRSHAGTRHIPVVLMTSLTEPEEESHARELGANAFFVKPVDPLGLLRQIDELLSVHPTG